MDNDNKTFSLVAVGGTFDMLHEGHKALLRKAFEVGRRVVIGLTTDELVAQLGKAHDVAPYEERLWELLHFLIEERVLHRTQIVALNDPHGPAAWDEGLEAIVVSEETRGKAEEVNKLRMGRGLKPLDVVVVPLVLAEDGKPISTSRIRAGEVDREGRLLRRGA